MSFNQKYDLLDLRQSDESIKTYEGRDRATGQPVEIHLFWMTHSLEAKALLKKVVTLPKSGRLIEFGDHEGTPWVVTRPLDGYKDVRDWIVSESRGGGAGAPPPMPMPPPPPAPPARSVTMEFNQMFSGAPAQAAPPPPPPPPMPAAPPPFAAQPPTVPLTPPKPAGPGATTLEFNKLFGGDAPAPKEEPMFGSAKAPQPPPPQPPPAAAPVATPPPPASEVTKEFSKLFASTAEAPPVKPQASEFTMMFQQPNIPAAPPAPPAAAAAPPPPPPAPPAAPAPPKPQASEFTMMFQQPNIPAAPPAAPVPPAAPAPPKPQASEFTMMFHSP